MMKTIELLAPAGSPEALDAAIGEGADAVYLGLNDSNTRLKSGNFSYAQFEGALRFLRRMGKKVYVTVNAVFEQREADRVYQLLKYLASLGPDAVIVQDFGVIAMARAEFPELRFHACARMNIASARGANALSRHGVSRVVLARELSFDEIKSVKGETNLELEVFVHGSLCVCVSGLCLFSSFLGGKSANRGICAQACRRLYHGTGKSEGESGYYFSPNDLQLLERIPDLATAGITALKIEGNMKSASYVGTVVSAYRLVLDAALDGDEDNIRRSVERGHEILRKDFARPKTQYLFNSKPRSGAADSVDWLNPEQNEGTGISLGAILKVKGGDRAFISPPPGQTLSVGDSVRALRGGDSARVSHKLTFAEKTGGKAGAGYWISVPDCSPGDQIYLIQRKEKNKHYAPVIARNAAGRGPGRDKAPLPEARVGSGGKHGDIFPEGLYLAVSRPEDLYVAQSSRPQRVILSLSQKNAKHLLAENNASGSGGKPLPFKPEDIILALDPWFPQESASYETGKLAGNIQRLTEKGYTRYILNNPGHFSLFKTLENVDLIAGPWLYTFNSWSLSFIASYVDGIITPFENNRQNLERTVKECLVYKDEKKRQIKSAPHSKIFITVFAWPPLFSIRSDLGHVIGPKSFTDSMGESFAIDTGPEGARVYPEKYFSIIDKIPFLKEAGFSRFIIDISGSTLKKSSYKDLIRSVNESAPLPDSSRFNWKNGFYSKKD